MNIVSCPLCCDCLSVFYLKSGHFFKNKINDKKKENRHGGASPHTPLVGLAPFDCLQGCWLVMTVKIAYSPRTGTRSKYLQTPWGVILTMEPNHHRRLQDAVGFSFFTTTNKQIPTGTTYTVLKFPRPQHKGFTFSQPKTTGSISQKSTHPVRKWHRPIGK